MNLKMLVELLAHDTVVEEHTIRMGVLLHSSENCSKELLVLWNAIGEAVLAYGLKLEELYDLQSKRPEGVTLQ